MQTIEVEAAIEGFPSYMNGFLGSATHAVSGEGERFYMLALLSNSMHMVESENGSSA